MKRRLLGFKLEADGAIRRRSRQHLLKAFRHPAKGRSVTLKTSAASAPASVVGITVAALVKNAVAGAGRASGVCGRLVITARRLGAPHRRHSSSAGESHDTDGNVIEAHRVASEGAHLPESGQAREASDHRVSTI